MEFEAVKLWLTNLTDRQVRHRRLLAGIGLALFPIATAFGGALVYGILFLFAHKNDRNPDITVLDSKVLWITIGIMVVASVVCALLSKKNEPEKFYSEPSEADDSLVGNYIHRRKVVAQFFLWIILTGPKLLAWSIHSFKEATRLKQRDVHSCAALLWLMLSKRAKVPCESIAQELDWLDLEATLPQILEISGVIYLKTPPPGISMTDDLRSAIRNNASI